MSGTLPQDGLTRVAGVLHVHTTHSDGGGTTDDVIGAARRSGLDFVVVTDHNNLEAKPREGYHGDLLLLVGTEISTTSGYILGLGIPDPSFRFSGDAPEVLEDIRQLGGTAFAAHPTSAREQFSWRGWDLPGNWGLEIINLDCQWRDASTLALIRAAAHFPANQRYALLKTLSRPSDVLERWDALLRTRHVPAIAASDAHSRIPITKKTALRLPSYESLFAIARNHVLLDQPLTGEFARDANAILSALAEGRSYLGIDALAPADGFFFDAVAGERRWTMGDTVPSQVDSRLRAGGRLPAGARLVLLRDGRPLAERETALECRPPGPGTYRVEVYAPGWTVPWVISNPIYVFDSTDSHTRAERARPQIEPHAPASTRILDDFEGSTVFRAEFDPSSSIERELLDPQTPWQGAFAGRMSFTLGDGGSGREGGSCALVSRERRDWTGASGLALALKGDAEYRVHVQVRDENAAARDEGTETWSVSAKVSRHWRRISLPFARFRSTDPGSDRRLDLDKIRLVAFVVDRGADKIGTRGTVWIDEVGIY